MQKNTVVYPIFDLMPFNWSFMQCHPTKQHVLLTRGESLLSEKSKICFFFYKNKYLNDAPENGWERVYSIGETCSLLPSTFQIF